VATDQGFVDHVQSQSGLGRELSFRKMFGEYALYLHGRVVAFACDNQLYLKPTGPGRALLGEVSERAPYPGGKPHFLIDEQIDDRALLRRLFLATAEALPLPKPKPKRTPGPGTSAAASTGSAATPAGSGPARRRR
jgi:TfoX/Sxy family transcriptional regulator of competence genes